MKLYLSILISLLIQLVTYSQKDLLAKAESLYHQKLYADALDLYTQVPKIKDKNISLQKAICLIETNQLSEAESIMNDLVSHDSNDPILLFYRALVFQHQGHYDLALPTYKNVLRQAKSKDPINIKARQYIKTCRTAQKISTQAELAFIENLGVKVNSKYNDFGAIQSPNFPSVLYFNSNRNLHKSNSKNHSTTDRQSDMYSVEFLNSSWSSIETFGENLNTHFNEQILGFPPDGSSVIYIQDELNKKSTVKINHFNADSTQQELPVSFNSKIKAEFGDDYIQVFSDSVFLYSSLRKEGLGGYDIYIIKLKNGQWNEPIHLGQSINSSFNDICPFLTRDGKQLFFSSNRKQSTGGYDIFMSEYDELRNAWSIPKNIGFPINSSKDDLYFRLDYNGNSANFSSDRIGGIGGLDLYVAYLKETNEHNTVLSTTIPFLTHAEKQAELNKHKDSQQQSNISNQTDVKGIQNIFLLKPLFFNTSDRLIYGTQENYLSKMIRLLQKHPASTIDILGHSSDSGTLNFQLYSSVRQTEELLTHFVKNGISADRIFVTGYGNSFPLNASFNQNRVDANKMNKRVTFNIKNTGSQNLMIENSTLSKTMISPNYEDYTHSISGLTYSIEISKTKQLYKNTQLNLLPQVKLEKIADYYHYSTGVYQSFNDAKIALEDIKEFNFSDFKIVVYISGNRILDSELSEKLKIYPDLANYIIDAYSDK